MLECQERSYAIKTILTLNITNFFSQLASVEHMT